MVVTDEHACLILIYDCLLSILCALYLMIKAPQARSRRPSMSFRRKLFMRRYCIKPNQLLKAEFQTKQRRPI
jgi:hypothetical protein